MILLRLQPHRFCPILKTRLFSSKINEGNLVKTNNNQQIVSQKFPDYKIVYTFPYASLVNVLNIFKRNATILLAVSIPSSILLHCLSLTDDSLPLGILIAGFNLFAWTHISCIPINNLIGGVYIKESESEVILSYLDYWGRRVDKKVEMKDITPLSDTPINFAHQIYRNIHIKSYKPRLKLFTFKGNILDKQDFMHIFGFEME